MALQKGQTANPNGRPKGSKNKAGKELREKIILFLEDNFDQVQMDFNKLAPIERARVYKDLLQFALPKLRTTELETSTDIPAPIIMMHPK